MDPNDAALGWTAPKAAAPTAAVTAAATALATSTMTPAAVAPLKDSYFGSAAVGASVTGNPVQRLLMLVILVGAVGGFLHLRRRNKPKPGRFPV